MTLAEQIEKARKHLARAMTATMDINDDAHLICANKRLKLTKRQAAGARVRMAYALTEQIRSIRALLWDLPGVDWKKHARRRCKRK